MPRVRVKVEADLRQLKKLLTSVSKKGQPGHDQILIRWIVRYKKFAKARFNQNSRGGGDWPPLKPGTRKRVKKRSRAILKDSETLSQTLTPIPTLDRNPMPGILTTQIRNGVVISFGGSGKHPYSKLSVARLATVHHLGQGRVPVRRILIEPSEKVKRLMINDVKAVIKTEKQRVGL